jgi:hypothetical protein
VETIAAGPQSPHEILEQSTDAAPQQAIHHVSNDLDCLKVGSIDKEKLPESRGQTRGRRSSLEALKAHVFIEKPASDASQQGEEPADP